MRADPEAKVISTHSHTHTYAFLTAIWEGDSGVIPVSPRLRAGDEYADVGAVSERKDKVHSLEVVGAGLASRNEGRVASLLEHQPPWWARPTPP